MIQLLLFLYFVLYSMMHMQVLLPGGKSSTNVSFFFIHIQNFACLSGKRWINLNQTLRDIFMHRTLTDSEFLRCLSYRCFCFYYVMCNLHCTLFDIILQRKIPRRHRFYSVCGEVFLYVL